MKELTIVTEYRRLFIGGRDSLFARTKGASRVLIAALLLAAVIWPGALHAQDAYPAKPIRAVISFPAGNAADVLGRIVLNKIEKILGKPIVVDNRGGGDGTVGVRAVADAAPDGYTILFSTSNAIAAIMAFNKDVPFDPLNDIEPVSRLSNGSSALAVNAKLPINSVRELIAYAKANPGKLRYGSTGLTANGALTTGAFLIAAGITAKHVPYSTATQALTDFANGDIDMMFYNSGGLASFAESGAIRIIATASPNRVPDLPNAPTVSEAGLDGFGMGTWTAVFVPAQTPKPIIAKLDAALKLAVEDPDVSRRILEAAGHTIFYAGPDELKAYQRSEIERYKVLANGLGLQPK